jgi:hypothetical protein
MAFLDSLWRRPWRARSQARYQQNIVSAWSMKEPHPGNLFHIHPIDDCALLWPRFRVI